MTSTSEAKLSSSPPSLPIPMTASARLAVDPVVVGVAGHAVARAKLGVVERDRGVEAGVGQPRQLAADLGVEPELELADTEPDQLVGAELAQRGAQRAAASGRAGPGDLLDDDRARLLPAQIGVAATRTSR